MSPIWSKLEFAQDGATFATLHLVSQMLGKLRIAQAPWTNHGWHLTLHPTASGMMTEPTSVADGRTYTLSLNLCDHSIVLMTSDGTHDRIAFEDGRSIADYHDDLVAMLDHRALPLRFHGVPSEIEGAIPFADDRSPRTYDRGSAARLRDALAVIVPVFAQFRAGFAGKASPVHFFWGSFDLAVTRFSGRVAPAHPGGVPGLPDVVTREAYSHEVSSAGFWPAGTIAAEPLFYSYAYPEPKGFRDGAVQVGTFDETLGEFVLPYAQVRVSSDPEAILLAFLQETYDLAANLGHWDRDSLEREPLPPR